MVSFLPPSSPRAIGRVVAIAALLIFALALSSPMVAQTLTFTTLAGSTGGAGAIDGAAADARFNMPSALAYDAAGNLFVADTNNHTIRRISSTGVVTTFAGLAEMMGTNDGAGGSARFAYPRGVVVDTSGNVYVSSGSAIRKIAPDGSTCTWAGTAYSSTGSDGVGTAATFAEPSGLAIDSAGNIYVADAGAHTIRKIAPDATVTTIAGQGGASGYADGTGSAARFNRPSALTVDSSGNIYVADSYNHTIRKITAAGAVSTLAGSAGFSGFLNGNGTSARFFYPSGVTVDGTGQVYVTDEYNYAIRKISPDGTVATLSGGRSGTADGDAATAAFQNPRALTIGPDGNIRVADSGNNVIRMVTVAGVATTAVGRAAASGYVNDTGAAARFNEPYGIAFDLSGNLIVADARNNVIRKVTPAGAVSLFAGTPGDDSSANSLSYPRGIATDSAGNLYVADSYHFVIRKITPAGAISTLAGAFNAYGSTDDPPRFKYMSGVAVDSAGYVYVADTGNQTIRKISPAGVTTTLAGLAGASGSTNGTGSAARFSSPTGIAVDGSGNVYVSDADNHTIRKITSGGVVTTLAGSPGNYGEDDGTGSAARFYYPGLLTTDGSGNLYVASTYNSSIRKVTSGGVVTTIGGSRSRVAGSVEGTGTFARFTGPKGIARTAGGTLYVSDANHRIVVGRAALADSATVDLSPAPAGAARQLGSAPQTATAWTWTMVRRPSGSTAALSSSSSATPTFTPDVGDLYSFRLEASTSSASSITVVDLLAIDKTPTVSLAVSPSPSSPSETVTMTADIHARPMLPTGTVAFKDGTTVLGTSPIEGWRAVYTTSSLSTGTHTLTAQYSGDTNYNAATSSSVSHLVKRGTTTGLSSSLPTSTYGESVTFTAGVAAGFRDDPSGSVTFYDGSTVLGTTALDLNDHAVFTTTNLGGGTHSITAKYLGDSLFAPSTSSTLTQTVNPSTTRTVLAVQPLRESHYGQSVTMTITTDVVAGAGIPSGSVDVFDGRIQISSDRLIMKGGRAYFTTSSLRSATHTLTARYNGTANIGSSTSDPIEYVVNPASTRTTVTQSSDSSLPGAPPAFTANVAALAPGGGTPTGVVTIALDPGGSSILCQIALSAGGGQCIPASMNLGAYQVYGVFPGDGNFAASTSAPLSHLVTTVPGPSFLTATGISPQSVSLIWAPVMQAVAYRVIRWSEAGGPVVIGQVFPPTITFTDGSLSADTAYLYAVQSVAAGAIDGGYSPRDIGTTVTLTDNPLSPGVTLIKAEHLMQLRTAVAAARRLAGLSPVTFTDAVLDSTISVKAVHLTELRTALADAFTTLGVPAVTYTDPALTAGTTIIKAAHVQELRNAAR